MDPTGTIGFNRIDYNVWRMRTTEYLPDTTPGTWADNDRNIVYTNEVGLPMLKVFVDAKGTADPSDDVAYATYYRYDDNNGRLILKAQPSAVLTYNPSSPSAFEQYFDLVNFDGQNGRLRTYEGIVERYVYADATTATDVSGGDVEEFLKRKEIRRGVLGTPIPVASQTYFKREANGAVTFPRATETVYRNDDGTGAQTTSFAYTWRSNSTQIESKNVTRPLVAGGQNGPGTPNVETTFYDRLGRPEWHRDAAGFVSRTVYDVSTGAVVVRVDDVDESITPDMPAGWHGVADSGMHLVMRYEVDPFGRTTRVQDPNGNITYRVYDDTTREVRTYPGWTGTTTTGPITIMLEYRPQAGAPADARQVFTETLTLSATPALNASGRPTGQETVSAADLRSLTRRLTNDSNQVVETHDYFGFAGLQYDSTRAVLPAVGGGSAQHGNTSQSGHYHRTQVDYDGRGRLKRVVDPTGTITRTLYNGRGQVTSTWVGLDDQPTQGFWSPTDTAGTDLVRTATYEYDNGSVGDGNLTKTVQHVGGGAVDRITHYAYDWRNRPVLTRSGVFVGQGAGGVPVNSVQQQYVTYDNLGRAVITERFGPMTVWTDTDPFAWPRADGVPLRPDDGSAFAAPAVATHRNDTFFDDRGRVYRALTHSVNASGQSTGTLAHDTWYDSRGNVLKTTRPGGPVTKFAYDGAGRRIATYVTDGGGDATWADAATLAGDVVLEEHRTRYDDAGNPVFGTVKLRFHDEAGTGALGTPTSGVRARVSYNATWYDAANRPTATADVGTNGGTAWTRPALPPARSDTVLVTTYGYDAAGRPFSTVDPRGIETRTTFDALGRRTATVEAYTNGVPTDATNRTTRWTYDGVGNVTSMTAVLPGSGQDQTTTYGYAARVSRGDGLSANNVLTATTYPDVGSGTPTEETYTLDRTGVRRSWTDRNGTTHVYAHDTLGRLTSDHVTMPGAGVDGTVRRLTTTWDAAGRPHLLTSLGASGNVINQVERRYNGLGQLTAEFQSHQGPVGPSTPFVGYEYSEGAGGANHSRLTGMTYPSGSQVDYVYNAGLDDTLSRLSAQNLDGTAVETYAYLGLSTVIERGRPEARHALTYHDPLVRGGDAGDQYTGLDRFGRVVDHRWADTDPRAAHPAPDLDRFAYGYDPSHNRLYRENKVNPAMSEFYGGYDPLNRLTSFARGTLDASKTGIAGSASRQQSWDLDALGNWQEVTTDGVTETRTHDAQNRVTESPLEIGQIGYTPNGEMESLGTWESGSILLYDAWGRLTGWHGGDAHPPGSYVFYTHDALNRRITREVGETERVNIYHNAIWQVLEEQRAEALTTSARYVWSPVYVDAMVLRERDTTGNGVADERLYVLQDANYNVTGLVGKDVNGQWRVVERYAYDPYGTRTVLAANWTPLSGNQSLFAFAHGHQSGRHELGMNAELVHFRHRDLHVSLGRWLTQDPLGYVDGGNLYEYVKSAPYNYVDSTGLFCICTFKMNTGRLKIDASCIGHLMWRPLNDPPRTGHCQ